MKKFWRRFRSNMKKLTDIQSSKEFLITIIHPMGLFMFFFSGFIGYLLFGPRIDFFEFYFSFWPLSALLSGYIGLKYKLVGNFPNRGLIRPWLLRGKDSIFMSWLNMFLGISGLVFIAYMLTLS